MIGYFSTVQPPLPQYVPDFEYHLVDLSVLSDERITSFKSRFLETVLLLMKYRQDEQFLLSSGNRLFYWLEDYVETNEGENFLRTTLVYLAAITDISKHQLIEQLFTSNPLETKAMTVLDYWIETGIEKGMQQGIERGIAQGIKQGIAQGIEQGIEQGVVQGIEKGVVQGRSQAIEEVIRNAYGVSKEQVDIGFLALLTGYTRWQVEEVIEKIKQEEV